MTRARTIGTKIDAEPDHNIYTVTGCSDHLLVALAPVRVSCDDVAGRKLPRRGMPDIQASGHSNQHQQYEPHEQLGLATYQAIVGLDNRRRKSTGGAGCSHRV